jgi:hypothetical protein
MRKRAPLASRRGGDRRGEAMMFTRNEGRRGQGGLK